MRRKDREVTDPAIIEEILAKAKIMHVGLHDEPYPYVVPLHYGYVYEEGRLVLYAHGAPEGYKYELLKKNPYVFAEIDTDIELVPGETACRYGSRFASIMVRGQAEILQDPAEKIQGTQILMKTQTGKDFGMSEEMVRGIQVIRITADEVTCKKRG